MPNNARKIIELHIRDDCMSPNIQKDDRVFIDRARSKILSGEVYGLRNEKGLVVRRIVLVNRWLARIQCDNPLYPTYEINLSEVPLVGRLIYSFRIWA
jgi:phage repressor protein C with HTH and peptisase S24 domain